MEEERLPLPNSLPRPLLRLFQITLFGYAFALFLAVSAAIAALEFFYDAFGMVPAEFAVSFLFVVV